MHKFTHDGWKIKQQKFSPTKFNTLTYLTFVKPQKFNSRNLICMYDTSHFTHVKRVHAHVCHTHV